MNGTSPELLNGWKEIATYLGKSVRSLQRYERDMGLPVRRSAGKTHGSVLATKAELDAWVSARPIRSEFRLAQGLRKTSVAALPDVQTGLSKMRRLQQEMLELCADLRTSVQALERSLLLIGGEEVIRRAEHAATDRMNGVFGEGIEASLSRLRERQNATRVPPGRSDA